MKWAMRQQLGPVQFPGAPVTADEVAISFDHRNPFARFPASEADMRAVLGRLPSGVLDGLNGISLSLGWNISAIRLRNGTNRTLLLDASGLSACPAPIAG